MSKRPSVISQSKVVPLEEIPGPPDGGWGWVVCAASFLCNTVLDGIAYSFGILLQSLVDHYGSTRSQVAWVGSLLAGVYMTSGPVVGGLVNKFGCRPVCIAGSLIACSSLVLSTFSPNVGVLMLTYGIMGGFGLGCIYLPSVIVCGYYFEKKRALATGIAVCGSGVGCFAFAPLANFLLFEYGWKGANMIFGALCLNCAIFGALMRPLELVVTDNIKEEQVEDGRPPLIMISPDDDEDGISLSDYPVAASILEEVSENEDGEHRDEVPEIQKPAWNDAIQTRRKSVGTSRTRTISENRSGGSRMMMPRVPSIPSGMKRNVSTPGLGRIQRLDSNDPDVANKIVNGAGYSRRASSYLQSSTRRSRKNSILVYGVQEDSQQHLQPYQRRSSRANAIVRPLSRKDIFYSGSILSLAESVTHEKTVTAGADLKGYRHSVVSIPWGVAGRPYHRGSIVASHLSIPKDEIGDPSLIDEKIQNSKPIMSVLREMMDCGVMLDPLFALICVSNVLGFLAVYVPYVYLPNMADQRGISSEAAAFVISLIGVSNTIGRVIIGAFVDLPWVSSLVVTNISLIMSGVCVLAFPFCYTYTSFIIVALLLGLFVSAYISLTSIVLVDLMGLDSLTSSFGLLVLFRGVASILGPPLAGVVYDATQEYDASFYMAGCFFILGGLLSFIAYFLDKYRRRKEADK